MTEEEERDYQYDLHLAGFLADALKNTMRLWCDSYMEHTGRRINFGVLADAYQMNLCHVVATLPDDAERKETVAHINKRMQEMVDSMVKFGHTMEFRTESTGETLQ